MNVKLTASEFENLKVLENLIIEYLKTFLDPVTNLISNLKKLK